MIYTKEFFHLHSETRLDGGLKGSKLTNQTLIMKLLQINNVTMLMVESLIYFPAKVIKL